MTSAADFRQWLMRRSQRGGTRHVVVLPHFGGPRDLVRQGGRVMRGVFEERTTFSLLVFGMARCAELLGQVQDFSLFSGIMTEHVPGMDLSQTGLLLERLGASRDHAAAVQVAAGGHPDWTALTAGDVRKGRLEGLSRRLAEGKLFGVLSDRLMRLERDRHGRDHAASTLEKLLAGQRVLRLSEARDDLTLPEVRLYYDGVLVEQDERTVFRCEAARLAAERVLELWRQQA